MIERAAAPTPPPASRLPEEALDQIRVSLEEDDTVKLWNDEGTNSRTRVSLYTRRSSRSRWRATSSRSASATSAPTSTTT